MIAPISATALVPFFPSQTVKSVSTDYDEVVKRVPASQLAEIEARIRSIPSAEMEKGINALVDETSPLWIENFKDKNLPEYAMEALRRGRIDQEFWGTCMYFWGAFDLGLKLDYSPIFLPNGEMMFSDQLDFLTPTQMNELIRRLKALSPARQLVLFVEKPLYWPKVGIRSVTKEFDVFDVDGVFVVLSLSVYQILADVFCDEGRLKLNPVLKVSPLDLVRENEGKDWSDVAVPHPVAKTPQTADGTAAPGIDYTFHDLIHFLLRIFTPKKLCHLSLKTSDILLPLIKSGHKVTRFRFFLMDLGNYYFRPGYLAKKQFQSLSTSELMWLGMTESLAVASFAQTTRDTLIAAKKVFDFLAGPEGAACGVSSADYTELMSHHYTRLFQTDCQVPAWIGACLFFRSHALYEMESVTLIPPSAVSICLGYLNTSVDFYMVYASVHAINKFFYSAPASSLISQYAWPFTSLDPDL